MSRLKFNLFIFILILTYTQGLWERLIGIDSVLPQFILEFFVILFIIFEFKIPIIIKGKLIFFLIIIISILSAFYNENLIIDAFLFLRYFIYSILIYYQLFYYKLGIQRWIYIFKLLIILILLQGIGAIYDFVFLGERNEGYVGIMSSSGGTTASTFPLLISSLIIFIYFFLKRTKIKSTLLILLLLISVFLLGYSSGKRAIYFTIPLFFLIIFVISYLKLRSERFFTKKTIGFFIIIIFFTPLLFYGILNSKGLNYNLNGNESNFQIIENVILYAEEYESSTSDGLTIGRTNTTEKIVENLQNNYNLLIFGNGFNSIKDETTLFKLGVGYGIVGITRDIISVGLIFSIFIILEFLILIKGSSTRVTDKFSSSLRFILYILFLFIHLTYSSDFTVHLKLSLIIFILLSIVNSPIHKEDYEILIKRINIAK